MLNKDYTALIKYKKLGLNETLRKEPLPKTLTGRKNEWYLKYEGMPAPNKPTKPGEDNTYGEVEGDPVGI